MWAIEGDIKGCFDNIDHRLLLQKLWRIGIHDKRVLKIISQMLKAGYMENDLFHATELGTPQGGILSPLLSNVYLNDFDWYVGRMYMEPHRQCKHKGNDTRRLKWAGVTQSTIIATPMIGWFWRQRRRKHSAWNVSWRKYFQEQNETRIVAGKDLCNRPADKRYTLSWLCGKGRTKTEDSLTRQHGRNIWLESRCRIWNG